MKPAEKKLSESLEELILEEEEHIMDTVMNEIISRGESQSVSEVYEEEEDSEEIFEEEDIALLMGLTKEETDEMEERIEKIETWQELEEVLTMILEEVKKILLEVLSHAEKRMA